jgi:hydroxyacylglutathione hydrolase
VASLKNPLYFLFGKLNKLTKRHNSLFEKPMSEYLIDIIPVLEDNYSFIVHNYHNAIVIDPSDAHTIIHHITTKNLTLHCALLTHHHSDHCQGVAQLRKQLGISIYGPNDTRITGLTTTVANNQYYEIDSLTVRALSMPGHTATHYAYHCDSLNALFTGDTLFNVGCGRMFEGTALQFYQSLQRLAALPDNTQIFCGHEYTMQNIAFAQTIDPTNDHLTEYALEMKQAINNAQPTIPTLLSTQKRINPFLRCTDPSIKAALGMENAPPHEVFAELRKRKNNF